MAAEEGGAVHSAPHEVVLSEAFVEQYYHIIGNATHEAHRLYVDGSVVTRPGGPDGSMLSFTSLQAIKEHYLTCEYYKGTTYDVLSVDSQRSMQDGILIMVIGFSTGGDNLKRKFSQTFYLAPQDKAHVVVNDMYRFVDEDSSPPTVESVPETEVLKPVDEVSKAEPVQMIDAPAKKSVNAAAEVKKIVAAEATPPPVTAQKPKELIAETAASDGAKKSYAAMVQSMSRNAAPFQVKAAPVQKPRSMAPSPKARAAPAPAAAVGKPEKKSDRRIVDEPGTSVFVSNLPMDAKPPQLYELFKEFGPLKEGGVQIRSSRASGRCFGFVSFESVASVQSMLKAAKSNPFKLGEHKLRVKEKQVEYDGSKQSGGRRGGGSKAQNGSVDESKTPTGSVDESKTPTGSADGSKSENGSSAGGGEDDDGFKTIRSRKNRNKKNSEVAPKVKA